MNRASPCGENCGNRRKKRGKREKKEKKGRKNKRPHYLIRGRFVVTLKILYWLEMKGNSRKFNFWEVKISGCSLEESKKKCYICS